MLAAKLMVPPVNVRVAVPDVALMALLTKIVFSLAEPVEIDTLLPALRELEIELAKMVEVAPAVKLLA
jgi:hypothetical protein